MNDLNPSLMTPNFAFYQLAIVADGTREERLQRFRDECKKIEILCFDEPSENGIKPITCLTKLKNTCI